MGMSEDIMKGGIPDDCNAWTKTGIVECLGTPDEHTDTFYRHGDWGIEEHNEHEFEVYAIVEGKPILVKEGFTTFRECTEFIRGSIASKRLETDVDEKDPENQTPKEEVKMVIKPFRMMMEDIMKANGAADDIDPADVELNVRPDKFRTEDIIQSRPFGEDGSPRDKVVDTSAHKGVRYGGSPTGDVGGVNVGAGYPAHSNRHPKVIKDPNYELSEGPANPTRSVAGLNTHLEGTTVGDDINPDSDERKKILGEPGLDALPPGTEVEGYNYDVKTKPEDKHSVYPIREEKEGKYFEGTKLPFKGDRGPKAAENYLLDSIANILPEEIVRGLVSDPLALKNILKEQGTNGEVSKTLRGFLVNNPDFQNAWNALSMGEKLVPGGGFTDTGASESGYYQKNIGATQKTPLSESQRKRGVHEDTTLINANDVTPFDVDFSKIQSPDQLISMLRSAPLGKDDPIRKLIKNTISSGEFPEYVVPTEGGNNMIRMKDFINDHFDVVMDTLMENGNNTLDSSLRGEKRREVFNNPSLGFSGNFSSEPGTDYTKTYDSDEPPVRSGWGPGLKARQSLYPDQPWSKNADLTHETKNVMDNLYYLMSEVYPDLKVGNIDQFYSQRKTGKGDDARTSIIHRNKDQVIQSEQDAFNRSKRGQNLNAINSMNHGDGATEEEQAAYNAASNAFYAAEDEKLSEKEAKAAAKREDKKLKEENRHLANKQATEDRIQAKKDAEHQVAADRDEVSEEYNRIINEGARSWYQHMLDKGRGKGKGLDYYVEQYMTKFPRSNFTDMESLKALEAQIKGDADASHTKYTTKPGEIGQPRADRPAIPSKTMKVVKKGEEDYDDLDDAIPSFRDLVKAETDKVDATRGLPTGYRYKPETRVFRDLYRTTVIDGKDDISTVMPKTKD